MTRRRPHRSITDAAKGPMSPNNADVDGIAADMMVRLQSNSRSSGMIRMLGVALPPRR